MPEISSLKTRKSLFEGRLKYLPYVHENYYVHLWALHTLENQSLILFVIFFFTWLIIVSGNVLCLKSYKNNSIIHFKSIRSVLFRVYLGQESHRDMLETWNLIEWCAPWELLKKYTNEKIYQSWFPGSHSLADVSIFCTQIENL